MTVRVNTGGMKDIVYMGEEKPGKISNEEKNEIKKGFAEAEERKRCEEEILENTPLKEMIEWIEPKNQRKLIEWVKYYFRRFFYYITFIILVISILLIIFSKFYF